MGEGGDGGVCISLVGKNPRFLEVHFSWKCLSWKYGSRSTLPANTTSLIGLQTVSRLGVFLVCPMWFRIFCFAYCPNKGAIRKCGGYLESNPFGDSNFCLERLHHATKTQDRARCKFARCRFFGFFFSQSVWLRLWMMEGEELRFLGSVFLVNFLVKICRTPNFLSLISGQIRFSGQFGHLWEVFFSHCSETYAITYFRFFF